MVWDVRSLGIGSLADALPYAGSFDEPPPPSSPSRKSMCCGFRRYFGAVQSGWVVPIHSTMVVGMALNAKHVMDPGGPLQNI